MALKTGSHCAENDSKALNPRLKLGGEQGRCESEVQTLAGCVRFQRDREVLLIEMLAECVVSSK